MDNANNAPEERANDGEFEKLVKLRTEAEAAASQAKFMINSARDDDKALTTRERVLREIAITIAQIKEGEAMDKYADALREYSLKHARNSVI